MNVGVIGCGNISKTYFPNLKMLFNNADVISCADFFSSRAEEAMKEYGIPQAQTVEELLSNPDVDVVLNLTVPRSHYEISKAALMAGKHVYSEKPLALEVKEGKELISLAKEKNLYLGCSPDTLLGSGTQTCINLMKSGIIGKPLSASVTMQWHGPEHEHPDPVFLYQYGAGPVFDYGPYYIGEIITLLGPAKRVCCNAGKGFETRTCTCPGPNFGKSFSVEVPTHVAGSMLMENGTIVTLTFSFDRWSDHMSQFEIYGTEGTLLVPDPDKFSGPVYLLKKGQNQFEEIPLKDGYSENSRGLGLSDMISAISEGRKPAADSEKALHALEIMHACVESAATGKFVSLSTTCN